MRHMVVIVPELTGYASIRHVAVSLPYAAQLIYGVKYMLPGDVKPPEGGTERRRQRAPRAPSLRFWSSWRCDATAPSNSASNCAVAALRVSSPRSSIGCWCRIDAASQRPRNNHRQRHHNRGQSEKNHRFPI